MLKRPQRYLLMILSSIAVAWTVLRLLPLKAALGFALVPIAMVLVLIVWARQLFVGRWHTRRRQWEKAVASYQRYEKMLLMNRFSGWLAPLHLGIHTLDGVARTRNLIAQALMQMQKPDEAEGWLRASLQRDPLYAVPYTNLGTIAAWRGQDAMARRHFQKAVDLGFSPVMAEQLFQRARQRARAGRQ
ncbi:MAG TPA: tetratricopeptide repeat protein [Povalibacter sp.]|uniref:tetratricopeptide repeat protein n=1 Tax=Povalibacter sp. TaxID=1962978 RepID=UPI002CF8ACD1|nr:tetratricopeptide repeat protein [Povalibacter sp.]HMN45377.1 tetratricopeptide repeat protein [Povalibacter sp.]